MTHNVTNEIEYYQNTIANNISAIRGLTNLNQEEISKKSGIARKTLIQIEKGNADPQLSTLIKISTSLNISLFLLLLGRNELNILLNLIQEKKNANTLNDINLLNEELRKIQDAKSEAKKNKNASDGVTGMLIGAAIGTSMLPGIGTFTLALLGKHLIKKLNNNKRNDEPRSSTSN